MHPRSRRSRAPTRSSARTTKTSTAAPAAAAIRRASPRPRNFRICWQATSMFPRTARRTRRRAATARKSRAAKSTTPALRHDAVAADIDPFGLERAVRLLRRADNIDIGARLELVLAADHISADHGVGADDDLLLAVLVLDHDHLAVDARHRGVHRGIGHGGVRPIPGPMTLAGATLRLGEDHDLNGALAAVGLGRRADADEGARLDIGQARLDHPIYRGVVGELHLHVARLARLDGERRAIHRLDRSAQAHA